MDRPEIRSFLAKHKVLKLASLVEGDAQYTVPTQAAKTKNAAADYVRLQLLPGSKYFEFWGSGKVAGLDKAHLMDRALACLLKAHGKPRSAQHGPDWLYDEAVTDGQRNPKLTHVLMSGFVHDSFML